jgi:chloride channel protein, CIC family
MAEQEVTSMPVVDLQSDKVLGVISLEGMLRARARHLEEERNRQQVLHWKLLNSPRTRTSIKRENPPTKPPNIESH